MMMKLLTERFTAHVEAQRITGVLCALYEGEREIFRRSFGYADCARRRLLQDNAIFRLASMTKPITATAVLICKERGLLDLDAPIGVYIKGFSHSGVGRILDGALRFDKDAREITIRDCLTHSSGLGSGKVGNFQLLQRGYPENLKDNVLSWNGAFLDFEPGSQQAYSATVAFELLAYAVEKVSGFPFSDFIKKEIFEPLEMKDTCYVLPKTKQSRLVEMSKTSASGGIEKVDIGVCGFGGFGVGYTGGSAGLFSTLDDYSRFVRMLAGNGIFENRRILTKNSVKELCTPQLSKCLNGLSERFNWGLGVRVCEKRGKEQPLPDGSYGWSGAYGTHFWVEPSTGRSAILMLNKVDVGGSSSPYSAEFEKIVCNVLE